MTPDEALARYTEGPKTGVFTDGACEGNPGPGGWGGTLDCNLGEIPEGFGLSVEIGVDVDAQAACVIENGTLHNQKQRVATLGTLLGDGFTGPALIVVGDVVRFARVPATQLKARAV